MNRSVALLVVLCGWSSCLPGRASPAGRQSAPPLEITLAWSADCSTVVGGSPCFWMEGGKAEANAGLAHGLSVVAELAGEHADSINSSGEGLSFISYLFGPRYSIARRSRLVPFAQFLAGGVHGFDAFFPNSNGSSVTPDALAFTAGGGLNLRVSRRVALRAIQADYLQTRLPNDTNSRQDHLRLAAGVIFRFGTAR